MNTKQNLFTMNNSKKCYKNCKTDIFFLQKEDETTPVKVRKQNIPQTEPKQSKMFGSRKRHNLLPTSLFGSNSPDISEARKKASFHKQIDQPLSSFYHQDDYPYYYNRKFESKPGAVTKTKFSYHAKDSAVIQISPHEKSLMDGQSFIFYDPKLYKTPQVQYKNELNYHLASVGWNSPHVGATTTKVNESAEFDRNYAKKRFIQELQSQTLPAFTNILDEKSFTKRLQRDVDLEVNQPNYKLKRQNQNFSDMFNQELGYKNGEKRSHKRNISASMEWQEFDSVRNAQEASGIQKCEMSEILQLSKRENSPVKSKRQEEMAVVKTVNPQHQQKKKVIQSLGSIKYTGLYKWKNNYRK